MDQEHFDAVTDPEPDDEGYAPALKGRQVQMIAIGGAIGTGLFLGAGSAIAKAGPSLVLTYILAGAIAFVIVRALGELLTYRPVSGSFPEYAREFLGPFAGFATGWTYWLNWVVTGMAEITAAAVYLRYWLPGFPQWIAALAFLALLFAANLISVKLFGEIEFWFAMIKVIAIIGMIATGIGVLAFGFGKVGPSASITHLWHDGGFFPHGGVQTLLALQIAMFAFLGVELVGVTAGESQDPQKTLPRAINTLPFRILLFYVGALVIVLSLVSWTEFRAGVSPFVVAFSAMGIPAAGAVVNFAVLTAALSSCNSGVYSTGRMLRDLALRGQAPTRAGALNRRRIPAAAVTMSTGVMGLGVLLNYAVPEKAFTYIVSLATLAGLWTWAVILLCQLRYRRAWRAGHLPQPGFKAPAAPASTRAALGCLGLVVVLMAFDADTRISLYVFPFWLVLLGLGYRFLVPPPVRSTGRNDHLHVSER